jgi:hypothetical protein
MGVGAGVPTGVGAGFGGTPDVAVGAGVPTGSEAVGPTSGDAVGFEIGIGCDVGDGVDAAAAIVGATIGPDVATGVGLGAASGGPAGVAGIGVPAQAARVIPRRRDAARRAVFISRRLSRHARTFAGT